MFPCRFGNSGHNVEHGARPTLHGYGELLRLPSDGVGRGRLRRLVPGLSFVHALQPSRRRQERIIKSQGRSVKSALKTVRPRTPRRRFNRVGFGRGRNSRESIGIGAGTNRGSVAPALPTATICPPSKRSTGRLPTKPAPLPCSVFWRRLAREHRDAPHSPAARIWFS